MLTFAQKYSRNVYSQFGEDGIIAEVLRRLNIQTGMIAEFGAHDGKFCSNSLFLIFHGWKALLIEADIEKAKECWKIHCNNRDVQVYCDTVTPENVNTMLQVPYTILSIDVDGIDAAIWKEYYYMPEIVIIEINSNLPPMSDVFADPERGSSYKSMLELGRQKGYFLLCHTGNMIFIRSSKENWEAFPELQGFSPMSNIDLFFNTSWQNK